MLVGPSFNPSQAITIGNGPNDPAEYKLIYLSGQATGNFRLQVVYTELLDRHHFLTPQSTPQGDCETTSTCTVDLRIQVAYPGFQELPAPRYTFADQPIPWVRCGLTGDPACDGTHDVPYNSPEHLRRHWGEKKTVDDLTTLAWRWYYYCSDWIVIRGVPMQVSAQDLVVSDMSLPFGGLFDIKNDWRPLDHPQSNSGIGHWTHRRGTDVDLSRLSVPLSGTCGLRPTDGTWDQRWKETALWMKDEITKGLELQPLYADPGHLTEDE
jgi:hypothetical protein